MKAALVRYRMDGGQEKSHHPEWPDHRGHAGECDPQGDLKVGARAASRRFRLSLRLKPRLPIPDAAELGAAGRGGGHTACSVSPWGRMKPLK